MERLTNKYSDGTPFLPNWTMQTVGLDGIAKRLAEYEDLEEQGKLLKLSCAVGDTVYEVQKLRKRIQLYEIISIKIDRMGEPYYYWKLKDDYGFYSNLKGFGDSRLGKDVFLTKEQAEAALQKPKGGD